MSQYITTHNADGKAVFSQKLPSEPHHIALNGDHERGSLQMLYTLDSFKPNVASDQDIDAFGKVRKEGLPQGLICPPDGAAISIVTLGQGSIPWHRTMTIDVLYILEGAVELHLDGGEMRTLKPGDVITQRGGMHKWKNVSPDNGKVKMFAVALPIQQPIEVGGQKLEGNYIFE